MVLVQPTQDSSGSRLHLTHPSETTSQAVIGFRLLSRSRVDHMLEGIVTFHFYKLNLDSVSLPLILERNATRGSVREEDKGWPRALEAIICSMLSSSKLNGSLWGSQNVYLPWPLWSNKWMIVFVRQSATPTSLCPISVWLCMKKL